MKTLNIKHNYKGVELRLAGLSFKKVEKLSMFSDLYRNTFGNYEFDLTYNSYMSGMTCKIKPDKLISVLKELHSAIPFDKIKTENHYELSDEELMKSILTNQ